MRLTMPLTLALHVPKGMTLGVAGACVSTLLFGGCKRAATPEECRSACAHVASLNRERFRENLKITQHEREEAIEASETESKNNIAAIKLALAEKRPPFETTLDAHRKVPKATMRTLREQYRVQGEQERQQSEAALKSWQDQIAIRNKALADGRRSFDADLEKMVQADAKTCAADCVRGQASTKSTACMTRAKAADEVPLCIQLSAEKR